MWSSQCTESTQAERNYASSSGTKQLAKKICIVPEKKGCAIL